jgi:integrase
LKGHVRKLKNTKTATWEITLYKGKDANGKKQYTREYAHSEDAADLRCAVLVQEIMEHRHITPAKMTLGDYLQRWLLHYRVHARSKNTFIQAEEMCRLHLIPELGSIPLEKLSPLDIQGLLDKRTESHSPKTVKHIRDVLRNALNQAIDWELMPRNPAKSVHLPRLRKKTPPAWTAEQLAVYLDTVNHHRLYAAFFIAAHTGMRRGEIASLKWKDVDLNAGRIKVVGHVKTEDSIRSIDLSPQAVEVLRQHFYAQAKEKETLGKLYENEGLVFASPYGRPVHPHTLTHLHTEFADKAGIPRIPFHGLRHTMATLMLQANVHVKIVAERLGHSDIRTTLNVYSHVLPTLQGQAANIMDDILAGVKSDKK